MIRSIADIGLTVPGLLVLIIIAVSLKGSLTVNQMAIVVASLAWLNPTRTIRSQVLTLRERGYVEIARLNGMSGPEIIFRELMPNLLPYLAATLVSSVSAAILASVGLEVLGLGPVEAPTLGMTLYWVNFNAAIINGWWWWWTAPLVVIVMVFLGLFFLTVGLDEIANPRLRRAAYESPTPPTHALNDTVLRVDGLRVAYQHPRGAVRAVDDVSFSLRAARALRPGGRIRVRQIHHGAGHPAHDQAARPDRGRRGLAGRHCAVATGRRRRCGGCGWPASRWCRRGR